jgi:hypothetical protein
LIELFLVHLQVAAAASTATVTAAAGRRGALEFEAACMQREAGELVSGFTDI